ncbi:hypothetical protein TNCV_1454281 [Trichonephila clavipes]|nr:hypothetical protein TNCV_1454281 [Trichonephila clavipes]
MSGWRVMRNRLNLLCYGLLCGCMIHHCQVCNPPVIVGYGAIGPSFPSASSDDRSASQLLDLYNTLTDFSEG